MKHSNNGYAKSVGTFLVEAAVKSRYQEAASKQVKELCCPVSYNPQYLKVIPQEILEKDYGCGDPSRFVKEGDAVLDLGSGAGKICYIASQIVGAKGCVIGVDFNTSMLELAHKYQEEIGHRIGWQNVEFHRARIQDLRTDLDKVEKLLSEEKMDSLEAYWNFQERIKELGESSPLIQGDSIDVIVSNCVLNLVRPEDKQQLFREMYRVLKIGGRVAISDIVSDEPASDSLKKDPELWSGCISGAFQEKEFLKAFEEAGFYGIKIDKWDEKPWRIVEGIEFRSVTITAYKGKEGPCWERNQAVIYQGPWKEVQDDDHHVLNRGVRTAVCDKTFQIFSKNPYRNDVILIHPKKEISISKATPFDCSRSPERDPQETKGKNYKKNTDTQSNCLDGGCC